MCHQRNRKKMASRNHCLRMGQWKGLQKPCTINSLNSLHLSITSNLKSFPSCLLFKLQFGALFILNSLFLLFLRCLSEEIRTKCVLTDFHRWEMYGEKQHKLKGIMTAFCCLCVSEEVSFAPSHVEYRICSFKSDSCIKPNSVVTSYSCFSCVGVDVISALVTNFFFSK